MSPGGSYEREPELVLYRGDSFITYIPDELEPPFDGWSEGWRGYIKLLAGKPLTLVDPMEMTDSIGVKVDGWLIDNTVERPGTHIVRWLPTTWLVIGKSGIAPVVDVVKDECDCPMLDVLRYGCKKHR